MSIDNTECSQKMFDKTIHAFLEHTSCVADIKYQSGPPNAIVIVVDINVVVAVYKYRKRFQVSCLGVKFQNVPHFCSF